MEQGSRGVDVAGGRGGAATHQLGGKVFGGAARPGHRAQVAQDHPAPSAQQHVRSLHVTVGDASGVDVHQRVEHGAGGADGLARGERLLAKQPGREVAGGQQLQDDRDPVGPVQVQGPQHAGVVQGPQDGVLADEAGHQRLLPSELGPQLLDGDDRAVGRVYRPTDDGRRAGAEQLAEGPPSSQHVLGGADGIEDEVATGSELHVRRVTRPSSRSRTPCG